MRVGLPADVKEEAVKTSGVVRFDNKVEVLLKITGTTVQEPAAQKLVTVFIYAWLGSEESQSHGNCYSMPTHSQTVYDWLLRIVFKSAVFAEKNSYVNRK